MKKLITIISCALAFSFAFLNDAKAQDEAIFSHYHISPILINPAYAGMSGMQHVQMNLRNQWTGFPGAPQTYMVNYNGPMGKVLGLGLNVMSEDIAQISRLKFGLNYAFRFKVNDLDFSLGFSTDFQDFRLANSVLDQANPLYEPGDFIVEENIDGVKYFDAAFGFAGRYKKATYFGLSFPNLIRTRLDSPAGEGNTTEEMMQNYIFQLGHKFEFEDYDFNLNPSLVIRKVREAPFQIDFNLLAGFVEDKLQAGVTYRSGTGGALGLLLGTKLDPFSAYFSYDVSFQGFQQYSNGTYEVTVAFDFGKGAKPMGSITNDITKK